MNNMKKLMLKVTKVITEKVVSMSFTAQVTSVIASISIIGGISVVGVVLSNNGDDTRTSTIVGVNSNKNDKGTNPLENKKNESENTQILKIPVVETEVPPVVKTEVPPIIETEVSPVIETEVPPVIETETSPGIEREVPPVIETETSPVIEREVPPVIETETPPVFKPEESPVLETTPPPVSNDDSTNPYTEGKKNINGFEYYVKDPSHWQAKLDYELVTSGLNNVIIFKYEVVYMNGEKHKMKIAAALYYESNEEFFNSYTKTFPDSQSWNAAYFGEHNGQTVYVLTEFSEGW